MAVVEQLITENIGIWSSAIQARSAAGRGRSNKLELYGVKKLRELILELAVRGLLVPQDSGDEPASELLVKIAAEKAKLMKEGKVKKQKALPTIEDDEKPFDIPEGWAYARLDDIGETNIGLTYKPTNISDNGIPVLRATNIQNGQIDLNDLVRVGGLDVKEKVFANNGDLLICVRSGSRALVGKAAMIRDQDEQMAFGAFMAVFRSLANPYLEVFINSPVYRRNLEGVDTTTINQITQGNLKNTVVPIPPVAEQSHIVAKVDELMTLCDQLEQQQESSITAHQTLVQTLLDALTTASERDGFTAAWARIADHFDTLFTTEWSIDQLKKTILQLAVMGRLVPQDPNDEPASELLKKIAAEKAKLVKDGKIKKQKVLPAIEDDEKPFDIPEGWTLERVGNLTKKMGSGSTPRGGKNAYVDSGVPFLRSQNVWNDGLKLDDIAYIPDETHEKMSSTKVYPGDVLLNITGASLGRSAVFPTNLKEANVSQHVTIIRLVEPAMARFIHLGILSPMIQQLVWGRQVGMAIEGLSKKVLERFEFPVPPLEEQHRIVTKVDELMALCDSLKTRINITQTTQLQLADAVVGQAVT